ncbi:MAG: transcriptional repressor [Desulfobacterales bacterium]|nr:MAG: transcriptional repressor [Desulfobacterales bacterium]
MDKNEIERRIERFLAVCKENGAKITAQRLEIFREIAGSEEHPHAELIHRAVSRRMPTISLDTVYRTLWWLTDLGMAVPLGVSRDSIRFDANLKRHHHFICLQCGLMRDFQSEELDRIKAPASITAIGSIEGAQIEIKGICHKCSLKKQRE